MGKITSIQPQKRREERFNIYLDGTYAFSLHGLLAARLKIGQVLSAEECQELQQQDAIYQVYERALRYLAYRPRSRSEMTGYLRGKGVSEEVIEKVLAKLEEAGWLDDAAFSGFWVENREEFRPRSQWALRTELRRKGVSDDIIEQALQGIDEGDSAYRAASRHAQRLAHLDYQTFRRRLGGFLQRRGFGYDVIKDTVEKLWKEHAGSKEDARAGSTNLGPSAEDLI